MSEFKVGDKVIRTGLSSHSVVHGNIYTVRKVEGSRIYLEEIAGFWTIDNFTLAEEEHFGKQLFGHKIQLENELQSRLVQQELIRAGGWWLSDDNNIRHTDRQYFFVGKDGRMSCTSDKSIFSSHYFPELKLKTVTSLEIISVEDSSDKKELQKTVDELKLVLDNVQQKLNDLK